MSAACSLESSGGSELSAPALVAGARDPANGNVDFPGAGAVTLQPGQQFTYSASRSFATSGPYTAWPAYFDGTNWIDRKSAAEDTSGDMGGHTIIKTKN